VGPQGPAGSPISLYDSTNTLVAPVVNLGCQQFTSDQRGPFTHATVLLTIGGRTYPLCVTRDGFAASTSALFYTSLDCSGQAFINSSNYTLLPSSSSNSLLSGYIAVVIGGGHLILYRPDYDFGVQNLNFHSYLAGGVCNSWDTTGDAYKPIQVADLTATYPSPLSVK